MSCSPRDARRRWTNHVVHVSGGHPPALVLRQGWPRGQSPQPTNNGPRQHGNPHADGHHGGRPLVAGVAPCRLADDPWARIARRLVERIAWRGRGRAVGGGLTGRWGVRGDGGAAVPEPLHGQPGAGHGQGMRRRLEVAAAERRRFGQTQATQPGLWRAMAVNSRQLLAWPGVIGAVRGPSAGGPSVLRRPVSPLRGPPLRMEGLQRSCPRPSLERFPSSPAQPSIASAAPPLGGRGWRLSCATRERVPRSSLLTWAPSRGASVPTTGRALQRRAPYRERTTTAYSSPWRDSSTGILIARSGK
jgi:hypothetical protein